MFILMLGLILGHSATNLAHPVQAKGDSASWVTTEDYPMLALRAGASGVSAVELGIDAMGRVERCTITESSGATLLDGTACGILTSRAAFYPATDQAGNPVPSTYTQRVRWQIPQNAGGDSVELKMFNLMVGFEVNERGIVENCKPVIASAVEQMGDPCAPFLNSRFDPARDKSGKAIRQKVFFRTSMQPQ